MEQKTDLSREFGPLPNHGDLEFGPNPVVLDPKTDPALEYSHPPDLEFGGAYQHQEFSYDADAPEVKKTSSRRERHRRTLLLQMAAVGMAAVVVSNSFGLDILGDDALFESAPNPVPPSGETEVIGGSQALVVLEYEGDSTFSEYLIYDGNQLNDVAERYGNTIRYDPDSNTLYLNSCDVSAIHAYEMDDDLTIYVERTSSVGQICSVSEGDCSVYIDGNYGESLLINQGKNMNWAHGIILCSQGHSVLQLGPNIIMDVYGPSGAMAVSSAAEQPIICHLTNQYPSTLQQGYFHFLDAFFETNSNPRWSFADENGAIATQLYFTPDGGNVDYPGDTGNTDYYEPSTDGGSISIHYPTGYGDSEADMELISYYVFADGQTQTLPEEYESYLQYSPEENTLHLYSFSAEELSIDSMGSDFTLCLHGNSHIGLVSVYNSSLSIIGSEGASLYINQDGRYNWWHGITMVSTGGQYALSIDTNLLVEIYGVEGAIMVDDTLAYPGIVYEESSPSGLIRSGSFLHHDECYNLGGAPDWVIGNSNGEIASYVCFYDGVITADEFRADDWDHNDDPIPVVTPDSAQLTLTDVNGTVYEVYRDGIMIASPSTYSNIASYDPYTNTLTLFGAYVERIDAYCMGQDFTIHVAADTTVGTLRTIASGENGCLILRGDNTMLIVNPDGIYDYGILVDAGSSYNYLGIDSGISISAAGDLAAIAVANSQNTISIVYDETQVYVSDIPASGLFGFPSQTEYSGTACDTTFTDAKDVYHAPVRYTFIQGSSAEIGGTDPGIGSDVPTDIYLFTSYSDLYVTEAGSITPVYIIEDGIIVDTQPLSGVYYDSSSNTLYLDNFYGGYVSSRFMGETFNIYLIGDNDVQAIYGEANSSIGPNCITLTGDSGATLTVNSDASEMVGIHISAESTESYLYITENINVSVSGDSAAIQVNLSNASRAIRVDDNVQISGGNITSWLNNGGPMYWGFSENGDAASKEVSFYGSRNTASGLSVTLDQYSAPIYLVENGALTNQAEQLDGLSYDFFSNTLTLTDFTGYSLESDDMGTLTVNLYGENSLEQIHSGSTLIFGGDPYAALTINESRQFEQGILISADGSDSYLQVNWGPEINVYGSVAAIVVDNTVSSSGIRLASRVTLSDSTGFGTFENSEPMTGYRDWTVLANSTPVAHASISRDYAGDPSAQATLSITVNGNSTVLFANGRPTAAADALPGVTYQFSSNTLFLEQVTFDTISASYMGEGFTIDLSGINYGSTISVIGSSNSADGSLTVTGDHFGEDKAYGTLLLDAGSSPYGILLEANGGQSTLNFDWSETIEISASQAAVMVLNSSAEVGIDVYGVNHLGNVISTAASTGQNWSLTSYDSLDEAAAYLSMYGGFGGGMEISTLEPSGINVWDAPSYDASRWIMTGNYEVVFVESPNEYDTSETVEGLVYDETTNTLTMTNYSGGSLEAVLMGNDFTIRLVGDNYLDSLLINASNVSFTGNGSLTVNPDQLNYSWGIYMDAQNRNHFMSVDSGVTLRVYGAGDFVIHATTAPQALILSPGVSASTSLAKNFTHSSYYDVDTNFNIGSANYSFVDSVKTSGQFTQFVHSSYVEITAN